MHTAPRNIREVEQGQVIIDSMFAGPAVVTRIERDPAGFSYVADVIVATADGDADEQVRWHDTERVDVVVGLRAWYTSGAWNLAGRVWQVQNGPADLDAALADFGFSA